LKNPQYVFDGRTKHDLKDKWRNLTSYKKYSERSSYFFFTFTELFFEKKKKKTSS